jgi:hypothetical protein
MAGRLDRTLSQVALIMRKALSIVLEPLLAFIFAVLLVIALINLGVL